MQRKFRNETIFAPSDHACADTGNSCNPPACCHNSSSWPFRLTQESRNEPNFDSPIAGTFSSMRDSGHRHILAHSSPSCRRKAEFGLKPKFRNEVQFRSFFLGSSHLRRTSFASSLPQRFLLARPGPSEIQERNQFRPFLFSIKEMDRRQTHPPYYNGTISGPQENR